MLCKECIKFNECNDELNGALENPINDMAFECECFATKGTKKGNIIADLQKGELKQIAIARKYGVSKQYVNQIKQELWGY